MNAFIASPCFSISCGSSYLCMCNRSRLPQWQIGYTRLIVPFHKHAVVSPQVSVLTLSASWHTWKLTRVMVKACFCGHIDLAVGVYLFHLSDGKLSKNMLLDIWGLWCWCVYFFFLNNPVVISTHSGWLEDQTTSWSTDITPHCTLCFVWIPLRAN